MGRGPEAADLLASKDGWSYLDRRGFRFVLLDRRRRQLVAALGRFDEEGTSRARYSGRSIIRTLFQRDQFVLLELEGVARSSTKHIRGTRWEVLADEE